MVRLWRYFWIVKTRCKNAGVWPPTSFEDKVRDSLLDEGFNSFTEFTLKGWRTFPLSDRSTPDMPPSYFFYFSQLHKKCTSTSNVKQWLRTFFSCELLKWSIWVSCLEEEGLVVIWQRGLSTRGKHVNNLYCCQVRDHCFSQCFNIWSAVRGETTGCAGVLTSVSAKPLHIFDKRPRFKIKF